MANKIVSAILCTDLHLREDKPICRLDDYFNAQWTKLKFISDLQFKHQCPCICGGDVFNTWNPGNVALIYAFRYLPQNFRTIYGQHDLPNHNLALSAKSAVNVLFQASRITVIPLGHFGIKPGEVTTCLKIGNRKIFVWHHLVWKREIPWPGCKEPNAIEILKRLKEFDLIVTGDNHKPFVQEYKGRLLVNPGSMMRMSADQIEHRPRVYLYYAESNEVEPVYLPIKRDGVISREHIDRVKIKEERINKFVRRLAKRYDTQLSFEQNLDRMISDNQINRHIIKIIRKALTK